MSAVPTQGTAQATAPVPFSPALRRAIGVIMIGASLSFLDSTVVNVALDTVASDLAVPLTDVQWTVTAYLLAFGAVIPVTAWAAQRLGAARLYLVSLLVFTLGSACCALSGSIGQLVASRALQGLGGGAIMPVGTIIWTRMADRSQMARVMSMVGIPIVLAPMIGPLIGGLLVKGAGWQSIFWINIPLGLVGAVLARRLLPRDRGSEAGPLDIPGLVLAAGGLVGLTYGLADIGTRAELTDRSIAVLVAAVVFLALFVVRSLRVPHPLLDMRLYANRLFSAAALTMFSLGVALFGGMILLPLYFQIVRGEDVVSTGLLLVPSGVGALAANRLAAPLTDKLGGGTTALLGGVIAAVCTIPFLFLTAGTSYPLLAIAMATRGAGIGLSLTPVMTSAYRTLPPQKIKDATPQLNVLQRVGGSIGTAVLTIVLSHQLAGQVRPSGRAQAFGDTFGWVIVAAVMAIVPTVLLFVTERAQRAAFTAHDKHS
ncbi:MDR family MFS transporter [Streptomyces sp. NPDC007856]|uniref:MDR family MFS transporter n=1 Tax=Streptomyces sp. NPDC007856 TaxID=3364781 RepID=UPI0036891286